MKMCSALCSFAITALATGSVASAQVLLQDDFNDNKVDPVKWQVVTANIPYTPSVVERAGQLELHSRGYLVSQKQFDQRVVGSYVVKLRFTPKQVPGDFDRLRLVIRGSGVSGGGSGEVSDGLSAEVTIRPNSTLTDPLVFTNFGQSRVVKSSSSGRMNVRPGRQYEMELVDAGDWVSARLTDLAAKTSLTARATVISEKAKRFHVMLYNREARFGPTRVDVDDLEIRTPKMLSVFPAEQSLSTGGQSELRLFAGGQHRGKFFLLLGSASGTHPGTKLGPNLVLALNWDWYFNWCVGPGKTGAMLQTFGVLNAFGEASRTFLVPKIPGTKLKFDLHHAFVVLNFAPNTLIAEISDPELLRIRP